MSHSRYQLFSFCMDSLNFFFIYHMAQTGADPEIQNGRPNYRAKFFLTIKLVKKTKQLTIKAGNHDMVFVCKAIKSLLYG